MEKTIEQLNVRSSEDLNDIKCDTTPNTAPVKCAVPQCKNKFENFENHQLSPFKFHNFPIDSRHAQRWKKLCKLPAKIETTNLKVCSDHFRFSDYVVKRREQLLNPVYKRSLRKNALPLLNVEACISEGSKSAATVHIDSPEEDDPKVKLLLLEVTKLKNNVQELKRRNTCRKQYIQRKRKQIDAIKKIINSVDKATANSRDKNLKLIFSEAQIKLLRGSTKKVFWTDDDLAQAFTLRHMGGRDLYLYLKNTLNYPLPALGCVQAWAAN